jgi:hypothetical protein
VSQNLVSPIPLPTILTSLRLYFHAGGFEMIDFKVMNPDFSSSQLNTALLYGDDPLQVTIIGFFFFFFSKENFNEQQKRD